MSSIIRLFTVLSLFFILSSQGCDDKKDTNNPTTMENTATETNKGKKYSNSWANYDRLIEKGQYKDALALVKNIYLEAARAKNHPEQLRTLTAEVELADLLSEDALVEQWAIYNRYESASVYPLKTLVRLEKLNFISGVGNYRNGSSESESETDIRLWNTDRKNKEIDALIQLIATDQVEVLKKTKLTDYEIAFEKKEVHLNAVFPTLYHYTSIKLVDYFTEHAYARKSSLTEEEANALLLNAVDFLKVDLDARTFENTRAKTVLKIYQDVIRFSWEKGESFATERFNLHRVTQNSSVLFANKSDAYWKLVSDLGKQSSVKAIALEVERLLIQRDYQLLQQKENVSKQEWDALLTRVDAHSKSIVLYTYLPNAKYIKDNITAKELTLFIEHQKSVDRPILAKANYRNTDALSYAIYRLEGSSENATSTKVAEKTIALPAKDDYASTEVEFFIDGLPQGNYKLVIPDTRKDYENVTYFLVSNYVISSTGDWVFVNDFVSGSPVQGKTVEFIKNTWDSKAKANVDVVQSSPKTDENGSAQKQGDFIRIDGLKHQIPYAYVYNRSTKDLPKEQTYVDILTDRAIYRLGQKVFFKAIAKTYDSQNSGKALLGEQVILTLKDANNQKVSSQEIKTNEFGSGEGFFQLPEGGLLGYFTLEAQLNGKTYSRSIRVEEYKRPKLQISWNAAEKPYQLEEDADVVGVLKTYSGLTISNVEVNYHVQEVRMWYYRGMLPETAEISFAGTARTNDKGEFTVVIPGVKDKNRRTIAYEIKVDYIDASGELVNSKHALIISKDAFYIDVVSKTPWKGEQAAVQFKTQAFNGAKVETEGTYTLYQIKKAPVNPFQRLWDKPEKSLVSESTFKQAYAHLDYPGKKEKADTVKVKSGIWKSGESVNILLNDLMTGDYYLVAETKDKNGNKIEGSLDVQVDKGDLAQQANLYTELNNSAVAGQNLSISVFSVLKQADVLVQYYEDGNLLHSNTVRLQDGKGDLNYTIPEKTTGLIEVRTSFVKQGRLFSNATRIPVKKSFPELNVEWISFRDRIEPNSKEQWKLKVTDKDGKVLNAEVLVAMYDQSLDHFAVNDYQWQQMYSRFSVPDRTINSSVRSVSWQLTNNSENVNADLMSLTPRLLYTIYPRDHFNVLYDKKTMMRSVSKAAPMGNVNLALEEVELAITADVEEFEMEEIELAPQESNTGIRENLNELAFFMPNLRTNNKGEVTINFNGPEALTTWRVLGLAHTKDLGYLQFERSTVTQKDLMVEVTLPRFAREGDEVYLTARVSNTTQNTMNPNVQLELFDLNTKQVINTAFNVVNATQTVQLDVQGSQIVEWKINVPFDRNAVGVRVVAKSGNWTDGEQLSLPILSNKTWITAALPFMLTKTGEQTIDYSSILPKGDASQLKVTLDYVQNPLWHVLMAMPDVNVKEETQTAVLANKLVALAAVNQILKNNPAIQNVLKEWKKVGADALASELDKNPELKAIVLAETPWVVKAQSQEQRKRYLAELLTSIDAETEGKAIWNRLAQGVTFEDSRKGWPWCFGMNSNVHISRAILTNLDRMKQINPEFYQSIVDAKLVDEVMQYVVANKWSYYSKLKDDQKAKMDDLQLVLLMQRFKGDFAKYAAMITALEKNALADWSKRSLVDQLVVAKIAEAKGKTAVKAEIVTSMKQRAIATVDRGTFWPARQTLQGTNIGSVSIQAAVIELLAKEADSKDLVKQAQVWLLLNKRSNDWGDQYSTSEAIYGLLKSTDWTTVAISDIIKEKGKTLQFSKLEAGSGYLNINLNGGNKSVSIQKANANPSFGTIYAQYLIDVDKVETVQTGLKISKTLYILSRDEKGKEVKTKVVDGSSINQGQKVFVELKLEVDQAMEFLQIKDYRAAGLEPVEQLSGYTYLNGFSAFKQVKDASVTYSIDRVERGVHVFGYELYAGRKGNFSNGYVMIQSVFNPEMVAYGKGSRLQIKE